MQQVIDIQRTIEPFWWSGNMWGESILPVTPAVDQPALAKLAFVPDTLPTLTSSDLNTSYSEGTDFTWQPGSNELIIPTGSRITVVTDDALYRPANSQPHGRCRDRENDILFAETDAYHRLQSSVTYSFSPKQFEVPAAMRPMGTLPRLTQKLAKGEAITIVLLGDSISTGCNATSKYNVAPQGKAYYDLMCDGLTKQFNAKVNLINIAVGGKTSQWGMEQVGKIIEQKPDMVMLAFGMNDASHDCHPAQFQSNISKMISDVHAKVPLAEFMLIATMSANAQWIYASPTLYPQYRDVQAQLQTQGIVLADVYDLWQMMVDRKGYLSFTGNGLNHPNDFGHRLYAQAIWATLMHLDGIRNL